MSGILLIGDSMVGGLRGPLASLLPGLRSLFTDSTHTAQWAANNYPAQLMGQYSPGVLLVALGTNDISKGRPASETALAARQIVSAAAGRRVIWIGPPAGPGFIGRDRGTIAALQSSGAEYFDSRQLPLVFYDNVHPNAASFQIWARAIAARVGGVVASLPAAITTPTSIILPPEWGQFTAPAQTYDLFAGTPPPLPAQPDSQSGVLALLVVLFILLT